LKKEKSLRNPETIRRVVGGGMGRSGQLLTKYFLAEEFVNQTLSKPRGDFNQGS